MSYPGHSLWGLTPLLRSSRCILQPQPTGQGVRRDGYISFPSELAPSKPENSHVQNLPFSRFNNYLVHLFLKRCNLLINNSGSCFFFFFCFTIISGIQGNKYVKSTNMKNNNFSPHGVGYYILNCHIQESEVELQSHNYDQCQTNKFWKSLNCLIPPAMGLISQLLFTTGLALALNNSQRLIYYETMK